MKSGNDDESKKSKHDPERFKRSSQGLRAFKHDELPENPTIVLFPGQGAQFVGMAKSLVDIPEAMDMFEIASSILKLVSIEIDFILNRIGFKLIVFFSPSLRYDLLKLCNEGPLDKLNQTIYCQPAVMVTSLGALELLKQHKSDAISRCIGTAGFSLGEITSLVFAGSLPFDEG